MKRLLKYPKYKFFVHLFFVCASLLSLIPFLLIISISLSHEVDVVRNGFKLIPEHFTLEAYRYAFGNGRVILDAYAVTAIYAVCGSLLSVILTAMIAYALSNDNYVLKKPITYFLLFTMFFNGGLIPSYIINTQWFHLGNNVLMYLLYGLIGAYTVFVFRTFFKSIPQSLIDAAYIDGATETQVLLKVIIPLSVPVLATFAFMNLIGRWNSYDVSMYYMQNERLYTLQYVLQNLLNEAAYLKQMKESMPGLNITVPPSETLKFAMCIVTTGPMLMVFPYFQKYFSKGMMLGAVKG